jgi:hypothetical protein
VSAGIAASKIKKVQFVDRTLSHAIYEILEIVICRN